MTTTTDGLGCIGKMITNFIGLMAALRRIKNIIIGPLASQATIYMGRSVCVFEQATRKEHGMTFFAQLLAALLFASGQFEQNWSDGNSNDYGGNEECVHLIIMNNE